LVGEKSKKDSIDIRKLAFNPCWTNLVFAKNVLNVCWVRLATPSIQIKHQNPQIYT